MDDDTEEFVDHECPFCGCMTYGMTFASPGIGMCRDCDLEFICARGACRKCGVWMIRPEIAGKSVADQHKPGCSLRDDPDYCHRTDDAIITQMGYEPNDARRASLRDAMGGDK